MSMTDPIADLLTRIRNGSKARHEKVDMPSSNVKAAIAAIFKEQGIINNFRVIKDDKQGILRIYLRYENGSPVFNEIQRVSKPGRRIYKGKDNIPKVKSGYGFAVISTSKGLMTDNGAREEGVGGEVLLSVW